LVLRGALTGALFAEILETRARALRGGCRCRRRAAGGAARRVRRAFTRRREAGLATAAPAPGAARRATLARGRRRRFAARSRLVAAGRRRRRRTRRAGLTDRARPWRADAARRAPAGSVAEIFSGWLFWARRARFHALRAAAASLRARFASRFASLSRLRARLSSSFAMRTRCLATSAWSRTRWRGSVGESCPLLVFFIGGVRSEGL